MRQAMTSLRIRLAVPAYRSRWTSCRRTARHYSATHSGCQAYGCLWGSMYALAVDGVGLYLEILASQYQGSWVSTLQNSRKILYTSVMLILHACICSGTHI
jgi:hypothetical protein